SSSGLDIDQRGVPRPQGAAFDIGAVEAVSLAISASAGAVQVTLPTIPSPPHLQASSALEGPWSYVLDTSSQQSYPLATGSPSMYFRLIAEGPAEEGQLGVDKEPLRHRHLAVILIDFPDTPSEVKAASFPTPAEMQKILFNDRLVPYLNDMSYGNFSISGDVFGYFTHQNPGYVEGSIVEVEQVVLIDSIVIPNFDITQYDGVVLVSVHEKGLSGARGGDSPWMSLTINGSPVSTSGIFSPLMVGFSSSPIEWMIPTGPDSSLEDTSTIQLNRFDRTFAHELFHYLGLLWHANSRTNGEFYDYEPEVSGNYQSGTSFPLLNWEYGNYFDVLGKSFYGVSLNASQRDYLGWSNSLNRSSIKGYGRYLARIHPLNSTTGIRMVEVRIPYQYNDFAELLGRKNRGYFLEVRTGDSEWDNMLMHPQLIENNEGIMVNKTDGASSQLLDMSPSPNFPFYGQTVPDLRDVVLKPGMVYENDEVRFSNVVKSPDGSFTVEIEVKRPSDK
ncbi:MAG TPA: choice-of-anchor Q domain-containing protein, partial [Oceanipulchritudo sp.]|nr:choice-of-anchor Q domain-containing protein [Oceanipulchritudo sp.]